MSGGLSILVVAGSLVVIGGVVGFALLVIRQVHIRTNADMRLTASVLKKMDQAGERKSGNR